MGLGRTETSTQQVSKQSCLLGTKCSSTHFGQHSQPTCNIKAKALGPCHMLKISLLNTVILTFKFQHGCRDDIQTNAFCPTPPKHTYIDTYTHAHAHMNAHIDIYTQTHKQPSCLFTHKIHSFHTNKTQVSFF